MEYQFSGSNNYRIMDTFLDSKKDFIILGLCGKTGSGSTTIAQILQTPFAKPTSLSPEMLWVICGKPPNTAFFTPTRKSTGNPSSELNQAR